MYINVLIGGSNPSGWQRLNATLQREAPNQLQIASQTARLEDVAWKAGQSRPDVLLLEHAEGTGGTLQVLCAVRQTNPTVRTLVLHDALSAQQAIELITHGVNGALLKTSPEALICKAVRAVHQGQVWFSRTALLQSVERLLDGPGRAAPAGEQSPTPGPRELLRYLPRWTPPSAIGSGVHVGDNKADAALHRLHGHFHRASGGNLSSLRGQ